MITEGKSYFFIWLILNHPLACLVPGDSSIDSAYLWKFTVWESIFQVVPSPGSVRLRELLKVRSTCQSVFSSVILTIIVLSIVCPALLSTHRKGGSQNYVMGFSAVILWLLSVGIDRILDMKLLEFSTSKTDPVANELFGETLNIVVLFDTGLSVNFFYLAAWSIITILSISSVCRYKWLFFKLNHESCITRSAGLLSSPWKWESCGAKGNKFSFGQCTSNSNEGNHKKLFFL